MNNIEHQNVHNGYEDPQFYDMNILHMTEYAIECDDAVVCRMANVQKPMTGCSFKGYSCHLIIDE